MKKRLAALLLILALLLGLCACGASTGAGKETAQETTAAQETVKETAQETGKETAQETAEETTAAQAAAQPIRVMVLSGTTGFGMAKLMQDAQDGVSAVACSVTVENDASNVTAALVSGDVDLAALPTNAASALYNKTKGGIQVLALNTKGVLYLMTGKGESVSTFADLKGKTVYVPAQNPTIIFTYLCQQNGLTPGTDVTIDNTYAQPADLRTALAAGEVTLAVLPEPMVTIAKSANADLNIAMDLTKEWDLVAEPGSLVQGCFVGRTEYIASHPDEVAAFLKEYEASVSYLTEDTAAAAQIIEETGILQKAAVAEKAIPNCNLCFLTGEDMKTALSQYLTTLCSVDPTSVGGAVPGDDFYYLP